MLLSSPLYVGLYMLNTAQSSILYGTICSNEGMLRFTSRFFGARSLHHDNP